MSPEEELQAYREELKGKEMQIMHRARKVATTFGVIAVILLITLVYIFFQQTQANKALIMAEYNAHETKRFAENAAAELKTCNDEIDQVKKSLQACKDQ